MNVGVLAIAQPRNGGTFQYTLSFLQACSHLRGEVDITIYCPRGNEHYTSFGFNIRRMRSNRLSDLALAMLAGIRRSELFPQEDVLLAPTYSPRLLHTKKPFAFTLHDLQERYYPEYFTSMQRWWRKQLYSRLLNRATRVICESNFVRNDIERFFNTDPGRISVVPAPPILAMDAAAAPADVQRRYGLPAQYFFYPAQFWRHKNHLRLVEAFSLLASDFPDCCLVLTGRRGYDQFDHVFERVQQLGLASRIRHIGHVSQGEMPALYTLATALVMPSLFESVSIPIFEAFRFGTPVCASAIQALPEQVGDAGILFDPSSAESMAVAMRAILTDEVLRDRLRRRGRDRIASLTHQRFAEDIRSILACCRREKSGSP